MRKSTNKYLLAAYGLLLSGIAIASQPVGTHPGASADSQIPPVHSEFLNRGIVAVALPADSTGADKGVFISWRSLTSDPRDLGFDIYRNGTKINPDPVVSVTNFSDPAGRGGDTYRVVTVGSDAAPGTEADECRAWDAPFMRVHLDRPEPWVSDFDGSTHVFSPDDCSIGDVDGDGVMEIFVKWFPDNAKDSAHNGFTGPTLIDCYRLDGTRLWRVDLGRNIRSGNHYTQFLVYDFDGDGRAELICKTAPGTVDGRGKHVLLGDDKFEQDNRQWRDSPRNIIGHVKGGGEYLTVFDGLTGAEIHSIPYRFNYSSMTEKQWGDDHCNRSDRYLACVAHLHGANHSAVMCRGYYNCATVWAVDFDGKELSEHWAYAAGEPGKGLWGEGAHAVTVGDVDGDGFDEIIYGGGALDHDGTLLYRTNPDKKGLTGGHGDALHLAKMIPGREGLQVFMPHESKSKRYPYDTEVRDARTGEILFYTPQSGNDIGRGIAANVSPLYPGYEYWSTADRNVWSQGKAVASMPRNARRPGADAQRQRRPQNVGMHPGASAPASDNRARRDGQHQGQRQGQGQGQRRSQNVGMHPGASAPASDNRGRRDGQRQDQIPRDRRDMADGGENLGQLSINFRIYWDGDLLDELYNGTRVTKPAPDFSRVATLADFSRHSNARSCSGSKAVPNLQADLFGDWREEIILHDGDTRSDLLIFTTTIPTPHKLPTLLQDHQYRMAVAWQNCCYNQPPHLSYSPEEEYGEQQYNK